MLMDSPFLGQLATSLKLKYDDSQDTAYTDGVHIGVNFDFFKKLLHKERTGVIAHETFHVMLLHHLRRKPWMEARLYNIAIDVVTNGYCIQNGFTIPKDGILPDNWEGGRQEFFELSELTVEQVYRRLEKQCRANPDYLKGINPAESSTGSCLDHPGIKAGRAEGKTPDQIDRVVKEQEQQMKAKIAQAYQSAKRAGKMSAGMERTVQDIIAPRIKWSRRIANDVASRSKTTHVWPPFNRRWLHQGIYLHGMKGESLGEVVWATDTSGSIDQPTLDEIDSELRGLARSYDGHFTCLSVDAQVCNVQQFGSQSFPKSLEWKGGGGTNYRPAFNWVKENCKKRINAMIYATDGYCNRFPDNPPPFPVYWVVWDTVDFKPPFGEVLYGE